MDTSVSPPVAKDMCTLLARNAEDRLILFNDWMYEDAYNRWMAAEPSNWVAYDDRIDECNPTPTTDDIIDYLKKLTQTVLDDFDGMMAILNEAGTSGDLTKITWAYDYTEDPSGVDHDVDFAVLKY